jgi:hypothetical protein
MSGVIVGERLMEKRIRSPNYPALSLPDALEKVATLYRNQHTHAAPREVAVKSMGYNSLNGASATAISALNKYGLLERLGDEVKISERALRIMHPNSAAERRDALQEAASGPALFAELKERFPGRLPNEEVLKNYLIRKNFAPAATSAVLLAYRKTIEFVEADGSGYDSRSEPAEETLAMNQTYPTAAAPARAPDITLEPKQTERRIGVLDLPDGSYVRIMASPNVDAEEALDWAEEIIALQRRVIAKRRAAGLGGKQRTNAERTNDPEKTNGNA